MITRNGNQMKRTSRSKLEVLLVNSYKSYKNTEHNIVNYTNKSKNDEKDQMIHQNEQKEGRGDQHLWNKKTKGSAAQEISNKIMINVGDKCYK
jgi:hypothetical protein